MLRSIGPIVGCFYTGSVVQQAASVPLSAPTFFYFSRLLDDFGAFFSFSFHDLAYYF